MGPDRQDRGDADRTTPGGHLGDDVPDGRVGRPRGPQPGRARPAAHRRRRRAGADRLDHADARAQVRADGADQHPADSAVNIPGVEGKQKINAAFNKSPALLIQTIENVTGLRIDHYVEVGFGGFASVIDSIGGIKMCLPKAMSDDKAHINLPAGCQKLDGVNALGYVRSRHADNQNDFGRVERQRQMVGAIAKKASSPSTFLNPVRYYNVATKGVDALTVDKDMSLFDFIRFARGMRAISGSGGVTLTVPVSDDNYQLGHGRGVAVKWDTEKAKALFNAIKQDNTSGLKSS